jgi:hypothetical protein
MITEHIKRCIGDLIADGVDADEILTTLVECSVIDDEYPELYTENGDYDEVLDKKIQSAVMGEIQRQLDV